MGKRLGQHFLVSRSVLEQLTHLAAIVPGEPVLEVGPGQGALTERLLAAGARVTAIELDAVLAEQLRLRWRDHPSLRVISADVLRADLDYAALFSSASIGSGDTEAEAQPTYAVIANLPYYLSTPLLFRFVRERRRLSRLLLMVQAEVAQRLVALPPEGHAYGSLSIAAHYAFAMGLVLRVPPGAFRPPPKVHSAVVAFTPRPPRLPPEQELRYLNHVKQLFTARRKRLLGTLKRRLPAWPEERLAAAAALVGERRPEALSPEEHLQLWCGLEGLTLAPAELAKLEVG